mmetsp:Transcript_84495/g.262366  ORF Transcript_84495/g.262366 Transcript_84495/m.262366 type:complete len:256 (+) Transcript_84495:156-923(+)
MASPSATRRMRLSRRAPPLCSAASPRWPRGIRSRSCSERLRELLKDVVGPQIGHREDLVCLPRPGTEIGLELVERQLAAAAPVGAAEGAYELHAQDKVLGQAEARLPCEAQDADGQVPDGVEPVRSEVIRAEVEAHERVHCAVGAGLRRMGEPRPEVDGLAHGVPVHALRSSHVVVKEVAIVHRAHVIEGRHECVHLCTAPWIEVLVKKRRHQPVRGSHDKGPSVEPDPRLTFDPEAQRLLVHALEVGSRVTLHE